MQKVILVFILHFSMVAFGEWCDFSTAIKKLSSTETTYLDGDLGIDFYSSYIVRDYAVGDEQKVLVVDSTRVLLLDFQKKKVKKLYNVWTEKNFFEGRIGNFRVFWKRGDFYVLTGHKVRRFSNSGELLETKRIYFSTSSPLKVRVNQNILVSSKDDASKVIRLAEEGMFVTELPHTEPAIDATPEDFTTEPLYVSTLGDYVAYADRSQPEVLKVFDAQFNQMEVQVRRPDASQNKLRALDPYFFHFENSQRCFSVNRETKLASRSFKSCSKVPKGKFDFDVIPRDTSIFADRSQWLPSAGVPFAAYSQPENILNSRDLLLVGNNRVLWFDVESRTAIRDIPYYGVIDFVRFGDHVAIYNKRGGVFYPIAQIGTPVGHLTFGHGGTVLFSVGKDFLIQTGKKYMRFQSDTILFKDAEFEIPGELNNFEDGILLLSYQGEWLLLDEDTKRTVWLYSKPASGSYRSILGF